MAHPSHEYYNLSEPDLRQLVTEPMIETTLEVPQQFRTIISFLELKNDELSVMDLNASENIIFLTT